MNPRVSVIMSVHNNQAYVREAVQSVLDQTFTDFEFIIFDDGSTDSTYKTLKSFTDKRIVLKRNKKSLGLTATLNKALKLARGEFIARMDGDDVSMSTRFEKQLSALKECDVCGTWITLIDENGKEIVERKYSSEIDKNILLASPLAHPSVIFRKSLVEQYGGYDEQFLSGQDYDLWLRYWSHGARFSVVEEPLVQYRIHNTSVKTRKTREIIRNTLRIKRKARLEYGVRFGVNGWARIVAETVALAVPGSVVRWAFMRHIRSGKI